MNERETFAGKYALFQSETSRDICCAVKLGLGAPEFIQEGWTYQEVITAPGSRPTHFDLKAARRGVQLNGYYIFMG